MNLLYLFWITKQTPCKLNYEEAQIGFVLRISGEHKLVLTLLSNFYLCNMATSVFRSNEAKVKDAVKLFTLSYLTSAVWLIWTWLFRTWLLRTWLIWTWLFWAWLFWSSCYVFGLSRRFAENRKLPNNHMDVLKQAIWKREDDDDVLQMNFKTN